MKIKKLGRRGKDKVIKSLGGYTYNDVRALQQEINELKENNFISSEKRAEIENEAIYKLLVTIEHFMRSLYGTKPVEKWASKVFNYIRNNKYNLLIFGLHAKMIKSVYQMDNTLTHYNQIKSPEETDEEIELDFVMENDND